MNIRPLLRLVCTRFLGDMCGLVDMCVAHVPSPQSHAPVKVQHVYTGPMDSPLAQNMINCDPNVSICEIFVSRLFHIESNTKITIFTGKINDS